jgi:hypothetical protein
MRDCSEERDADGLVRVRQIDAKWKIFKKGQTVVDLVSLTTIH